MTGQYWINGAPYPAIENTAMDAPAKGLGVYRAGAPDVDLFPAVAQTVTGANGITSGEVFGSGGVIAGPINGGAGIVSGEVFGSGGVIATEQEIVGGTGIASGEAFGSGGAISIHSYLTGVVGIVSGEAFGAGGAVSAEQVISPYSIDPITGVGEPDFISTATRWFVYVNCVDFTEWVTESSIDLSFEMTGGRSTARFSLFDEDGELDIHAGYPVVIYYGEDRLFGGSVENLDIEHYNGTGGAIRWDVSCTDYVAVCSNRVITDYTATAGASLYSIVNEINDNFLDGEGFTFSSVAAVSLAESVSFKMTKVDEAFNKLADAFRVDWWINPWKVGTFGTFGSNAAPFTIRDNDGNWDAIKVSEKRGLYRNVQYIATDSGVVTTRTESFVGDGVAQRWALYFTAEQVSAVRLNGIAQDVGLLSDDPTGWDFAYENGGRVLYQNPGAAVLTGSDTIEVDYQGGITNVAVSVSSSEIAARASVEGGSGKYESVALVPTVKSADNLTAAASGRRLRYGNGMPYAVELQTHKYGLMVGQVLDVDLSTPAIDAEFLIASMSIKEEQKTVIRYSVRGGANEDATPQPAQSSWSDIYRDSGLGNQYGNNAGFGGSASVIMEARFFLALTIPGQTNPGLQAGTKLGNPWVVRRPGTSMDVAILCQGVPSTDAEFRLMLNDSRTDVVDTVDAGANTFEVTAGHDLIDDDLVTLSTTGTLPAGVTTGTAYYVVSATSTLFSLAATRGGAAINITDTGSGAHSFTTDRTPLASSNFVYPAGRVTPITFSVGGEPLFENKVLTVDVVTPGTGTTDVTIVFRYTGY